MSAYIVDLDHIAYLVQAGTSRVLGMEHVGLSWVWNIDREAGTHDREALRAGDWEQAQRVGQMLWDENVKSVQARYPGDRELPGPIGCDYQYPEDTAWFHNIDPMQVLKACDCYEYQSCEHDRWPTSEAKAYVDALRARAWTSLPGYDDAAWGVPERKVSVA